MVVHVYLCTVLVQFEKEEEDLFSLDKFLTEA